MAQNFSNVMDYKVVANNGFQFNVNVYGVNNFGNRKWMLRAVEVIRDYFTFNDDADNGLIVNVIVNTHEIIVKAEFNGKKYFAFPIQPRYGKNQIKDILNNMGVVKDVIDVYTNNMVNNNMEENNMNDMAMTIENLVDGFNEKIEEIIDGIFNNTCENAVYNAEICNDTENDYVYAEMDWDIDILSIWLEYVEEWAGEEYLDMAVRYYNDWENRRIYDEDGICEYVGDVYGDYIYDNCCGSCSVYVKNPYYVAEDVVKNDAPCLDEDEYDDNEWSDRDLLIKNTADTIKDYLGNYMPSYLDKFGDCVITVYWDEFDEDMMKSMIEDDNFALQVKSLVYGVDGIEGFLVYDDGVYVSVDYDKMFNKVA